MSSNNRKSDKITREHASSPGRQETSDRPEGSANQPGKTEHPKKSSRRIQSDDQGRCERCDCILSEHTVNIKEGDMDSSQNDAIEMIGKPDLLLECATRVSNSEVGDRSSTELPHENVKISSSSGRDRHICSECQSRSVTVSAANSVSPPSSINSESQVFSGDSVEDVLPQNPKRINFEETALVVNPNNNALTLQPARANVTPVEFLAGVASGSIVPLNKDASHMVVHFNPTTKAEVHVHTETEPKSSTASMAVPKDTGKENNPQSPSDNTSGPRAFKDIVDGAWHRVPSVFDILGYFAFVFEAPLRSLGKLLIGLALIIFGVGWVACHYSFLYFFSICHASANNPLCYLPYSHNMLAFCPGPVEIETLAFFNSTNAYLKIANISEEAHNLPTVVDHFRIKMHLHYIDLMTSNYQNATELALPVKDYVDHLEQATLVFHHLNYLVFIYTATAQCSVQNLGWEMSQLERRSLQPGILDRIRQLFGSSTEPSMQAYAELWIDFLSYLVEPAEELHDVATQVHENYTILGEKLKRIVFLSEAGHKQQISLLRSRGLLTHMYHTPEVMEVEDTKKILKDLRDASVQSQGVLVNILACLMEIKNSSKFLIDRLRRGKLVHRADMKSQMKIIADVLARVEEVERRTHQNNLDRQKAWGEKRRLARERAGKDSDAVDFLW